MSPKTKLKKETDRSRLERYRMFAQALSYPDDEFFSAWKGLDPDQIRADYDRLFRAQEVWLYEGEHVAKHEFQRANVMADICAFYEAFGVRADRERPDAITTELEFMHLLIFKRLHALELGGEGAEKNAEICADAEKKFFEEHLSHAARGVAHKILTRDTTGFYAETAKELLTFIESEEQFLEGNR